MLSFFECFVFLCGRNISSLLLRSCPLLIGRCFLHAFFTKWNFSSGNYTFSPSADSLLLRNLALCFSIIIDTFLIQLLFSFRVYCYKFRHTGC